MKALLAIQDPAIHMLTLKVLSSFEFDCSYSSFDNIDTIQFRPLRQHHIMSATQFLIRLGLYYVVFMDIDDYKELPTDYAGALTPQRAYRALCRQGQYKPGVSKPYVSPNRVTGTYMSF